MKHKLKYISLILIFIILSASIAGCYDLREVDDMAYAIAIGLDEGENNFLKLTLQFAAPLTLSTGGSGSSGDEKKNTNMITVETPTLYAGLNMINVSLSKQVNLSHAKLIVFSEEIAKKGLTKYLHALVRRREVRPGMYIAIARTSAENYIEKIKPILDPHPAKFYELLFAASSYTGFFSTNELHDF